MRVLLIVVVAVSSTACAATGARPEPFPGRDRTAARGERVADTRDAGSEAAATGYQVSGTALGLRGARYRSGGADPSGFDCSGLVWYVFAQHGLSLPRTVEEQFRAGSSVSPADLAPGDLVFFSTSSPGPSHVGIVIGGDSFVHAPSSSGVVRVERLGATYWASRFVAARRVLDRH